MSKLFLIVLSIFTDETFTGSKIIKSFTLKSSKRFDRNLADIAKRNSEKVDFIKVKKS